jgi:hypothetical protein
MWRAAEGSCPYALLKLIFICCGGCPQPSDSIQNYLLLNFTYLPYNKYSDKKAEVKHHG